MSSIDPDIAKLVDDMEPTSLAQRVAMENTLQERRNLERASAKPIVSGPSGMSMSEVMDKLRAMGSTAPPVVLPEDESTTFSITKPPWSSAPWQITSDGRQAILPMEVLRALLNTVGGCVVLDSSDLISAQTSAHQQVTVTQYQDPWKLVFRLEEVGG